MSDAGTANVINLVLTGITAVGLGVTVWQAWRARRSSADARESARQAADSLSAAQASAAAQERTAAAMEELQASLEAQAIPRENWEVQDVGGAHYMWAVMNRTGHVANAIIVVHPDNRAIKPVDDSPRDVPPGEGIGFAWDRRLQSPRAETFAIVWGVPGTRGRQRESKTVIWPD